MNKTQHEKSSPNASINWAQGDFLGLDFPSTLDDLKLAGAPFLTAALRASGKIAKDNAVICVDSFSEVHAGGMGRKAILELRYKNDQPNLNRKLFAKFSIEPDDPIFALYAGIMNPEIAFALLSRQSDFPIRVPECYYADLNEGSGQGILLTECIPFGENGVHNLLEKGKDFQCDNIARYYHTAAKTLGELAAYDKAGKIDLKWKPYLKVNAATQAYTEYDNKQLAIAIDKLYQFLVRYPNLFPASQCQEPLLEKLRQWIPRIARNFNALQEHVNSYDSMVAINHWNAALDNAWFWDDANGLNIGLLDWGNVGAINLAEAYINMLFCGEIETILDAGPAIAETLIQAYESNSGIEVNRDDFKHCFHLLLGINYNFLLFDTANRLEDVFPQLGQCKDKYDPILTNEFSPRLRVRILINHLHYWHSGDIEHALSDAFDTLGLNA